MLGQGPHPLGLNRLPVEAPGFFRDGPCLASFMDPKQLPYWPPSGKPGGGHEMRRRWGPQPGCPSSRPQVYSWPLPSPSSPCQGRTPPGPHKSLPTFAQHGAHDQNPASGPWVPRPAPTLRVPLHPFPRAPPPAGGPEAASSSCSLYRSSPLAQGPELLGWRS